VEPIALASQLNDVCSGKEAIEDGRGRGHVAEECAPVLGGSVRGDDGGGVFVAAYETSRRSSAALGPSVFMPRSSMTSKSIFVSLCTTCLRWPMAWSRRSWHRSKALRTRTR
jgi:hypothetical protein